MIRSFKKFAADASGAFAVTFALMSIVLIALGGAAVDYSWWYTRQAQVQKSVDAAALAVASSSATTDEEVMAVVEAFMEANAVGEDLTIDEANYDAVTRHVTIRVGGIYPTLFVQLVGVQTMPIGAAAVAERALMGEVEVALVLDNTWSMSDRDETGVTKIAALKTAANGLVDTLLSGDDANVRISLVPYANYVNVGTPNRGQPWLQVPDDYSVVTPRTCTTISTRTTCVRGAPQTCTRVVDGVRENYDCTPSTCTTVNITPYEQCTAERTTWYRWYGCVYSRNTGTLRLSDLQPSTPYKGFLGTSQGCLNPIVPLTNAITTLKSNINAMIVNIGSGYRPLTYIPTGLVWGINTLSPTQPFTQGDAYDPDNKKPRKVLVLMTDGDNTLQYRASDGAHVALSSNATTALTQKTQTDTDTMALCVYAKSQHMDIYTVSFGVITPAANTLLRNCASSPDNYYSALNADELKRAFDNIARSLLQVRLVQ